MTVFIYGCNCGTVGRAIRKIKAYAKKNGIPLEIKNSKYDPDVRFDHLNWLRLNALETDSYMPIVVEKNNVIPLSQWTRS